MILIAESIITTSQVGPVPIWANMLSLFLYVKEIKLRKPNINEHTELPTAMLLFPEQKQILPQAKGRTGVMWVQDT